MSDWFGKEIFKLGFGLMRLPKTPDGKSDVEHVSRMVDKFLEAGGTYFDTAFVYGDSEETIGKALVARHPRESYTLATKLNAGMAQDAESAKQQFYTSLERTGAGYFDFYLMHAMGSRNMAKYEDFGIWDFVKEQKAKGLIKHIGFSFHDTPECLDELLNKYPEAEFVQLQLNYADWENPDVQSRGCYEVARKHGKSIVVMEPVKGGALADPIPAVKKIFKDAAPEMSCASWAIRYIAGKEGILTVLSGMSNIEQMEDNLSYMKDFQPLTEAEEKVVAAAVEAMNAVETIPCTACHYCTDGCPMSIPIPDIFRAQNQVLVYNQLQGAKFGYARATKDKGKASDCIQCGQCEEQCPQHISIIELLQKCAATLE